MVMFKAHFKPSSDKPGANAEPKAQQQQQQQQPRPTPQQEHKVPPIEQERGPQYPIKEPGPGNPPERAR
jgi:hypothetical protein